MDIEDDHSIAGGVPELGRIKRSVSTFLWLAVVTGVGLGWVAFWGLVARLQLRLGDFVSAAVVGLLFVLPAIAGLAYFLRSRLPGA